MIKKFGFLLAVTFVVTSCMDEKESLQLDDSQYNGMFLRLQVGDDPIESPVTLTLQNGTYTGEADSLNYPAICEGSYSIKGNNITFSNECGWTANFDWSLILNGTYTIEKNSQETVFIQEVSENKFNIYRFNK